MNYVEWDLSGEVHENVADLLSYEEIRQIRFKKQKSNSTSIRIDPKLMGMNPSTFMTQEDAEYNTKRVSKNPFSESKNP